MANKITTALNRMNQYLTTKKELSALTDRELIDIGISRWDIKQVAREHAAKVFY